MKESEFIRQNKEKWLEFEKLQSDGQKDPDRRARLFVEITNDLSYARTHYRHRSVRLYLNNIAQKVFRNIYKNRRLSLRSVGEFWVSDLPVILYRERRTLLLSAVIFVVSMLIGVLSSTYDPDFSRYILGPDYIRMTEDNIAKNDPMAVYKSMNQAEMTLGITFNNIMVAFRTFILGILAAVGTLGILIYNGIMVGVFQYYFIERGLFWESFLTIWQHGTIEISAIIIAGAAGITMGRGLLYPGTLTRIQSFQRSALRGLKIMVGIIPLFIIAGFIEGFITRLTDLPDIIRLMVILLSAALIVGYFIIYPRRFKTQAAQNDAVVELNPSENRPVEFGIIRTALEMIGENVYLLRTKVKSVFKWILLSSLVTSALLQSGLLQFLNPNFIFSSGFPLQMSSIVWMDKQLTLVAILVILCSTTLGILTWRLNNIRALQNGESELSRWTFIRQNSYKIFLFIALFGVIRFFSVKAVIIIAYLISPIFLLFAIVSVYSQINPAIAMKRSMNYILGHFGVFFSISIVFCLLSILILWLLNSPFIFFYYEILNWNFFPNPDISRFIINTVMGWLALTSVQLIVGFAASSLYLFVDTAHEITYGEQLKKQVEALKSKRG